VRFGPIGTSPHSTKSLPIQLSPPFNMRSQIVALFAAIVVLALVQAAPNGINRGLDNRSLEPRTLDKVWSALELLIYRLTHGGQYPPGYGQTPVTSTRTTAVVSLSRPKSITHVRVSAVLTRVLVFWSRDTGHEDVLDFRRSCHFSHYDVSIVDHRRYLLH